MLPFADTHWTTPKAHAAHWRHMLRSRDRAAASVIELVAAACDVTPGEILSPRRCRQKIAVARQLAMYLVHTALGRSYLEVAVLFRRDRTTIAYACARIEDRRDDRTPFEDGVLALEARIAPLLEADHAKA